MRQAVRTLVVSAVAGAWIAACGQTTAVSPSGVPVGQEFTLSVGDSVFVDEGGLRVAFDAVVRDSRCPLDAAVCASAGQVVVAVTAGTGRGTRYELRLNDSVSLGSYRLRLVRVDPYPSSSTLLTQTSPYRATFLVERA